MVSDQRGLSRAKSPVRIPVKFESNEWLKALEEAEGTGRVEKDDGFTMVELSEIFGTSYDRTRSIVCDLIRIGRVVPKHGFRPAVDGIRRHVPVYRLKEAEK